MTNKRSKEELNLGTENAFPNAGKLPDPSPHVRFLPRDGVAGDNYGSSEAWTQDLGVHSTHEDVRKAAARVKKPVVKHPATDYHLDGA